MAKFKVKYSIQGEIEIEADDERSAISNFEDEVGFSEDDLYDCINTNFKVITIEEVND